MPIVVVLGDINVDLLLFIDAYPQEGGEAIASKQVRQLGGSATNTAICLSRMGITVRMIGRVGRDVAGDAALIDMAGAGVETRWIAQDSSEPTQTNIVIVDGSGERTMFAYRGANVRLSPEQIDVDALQGAGLVHLSGYSLLQSPQRDAALKLVALADKVSLPVTLDIPAGIAAQIGSWVHRYASSFDTVILGEADVAQLGFSAPQELIDLGIRIVVVKCGAGGCILVSRQASMHIPGIVVRVVDTTGAGDAMAAGVITGYLTGLSAQAACQLGAALGALTVGRTGAGLSMPSATEVKEFFSTIDLSEEIADQIRTWMS